MYGKMYSVVQYSSSLTSEPFLYEETKKIVSLRLSGMTDEEIRRKVVEENSFNYKSIKQASRMLPIIQRRILFLDDYLADVLVNGDESDSKIVGLYLIMKNNLLFQEFVEEVYMNKIISEEPSISKIDVNYFFNKKKKESPIIAKWQPRVIKKLGQVYLKNLYDAGLLDNTRECNVVYMSINDNLLMYIIGSLNGKIIEDSEIL